MKIISKAVNKNNSRVTLEFESTIVALSNAANIAKKNNCSFSHNVTSRPVVESGEVTFPFCFGTISFNQGDHENAMNEFISKGCPGTKN